MARRSRMRRSRRRRKRTRKGSSSRRRRRRSSGHRRRSRKGGNVVGALKTAMLPFLLYKGQKYMQRKVRRKTKKRKR